ncbi:MAG: FecR domain-containing protein [Tannerella sp.]|jgi:ferric-dicitrate binding protein FerR (iron transport regulator)|nr:FecR domain-containing protein [Tannerella sp.]
MISKEQEELDRAWEKLCRRLLKEGLMTEAEAQRALDIGCKKTARTAFDLRTALKWVAAAAVIFIFVLSLRYLSRDKGANDVNLLILTNEPNAPTLAKTLDDGTVVYLAGGSSLEYPDSFADDKRKVSFEGEAFFDVRKNQGQPFVIETKRMIVEVTGTSFGIISEGRSFKLSVHDGNVLLSPKNGKQSVNVTAGETALLQPDGILVDKTDADSDSDVDICFDLIHFKDERLADILEIINLHSQDSVKLKATPEIEDRLLTFTFSKSYVGDIADIISKALNISYLKKDNTIIIYSPK